MKMRRLYASIPSSHPRLNWPLCWSTLLLGIIAISTQWAPRTKARSTRAFKEEQLASRWRGRRETCAQWISAQRSSRAYLDFYLIGVQKGATSELATRLWDLGVIDVRMKKSWEYLEKIRDSDAPSYPTALHLQFTYAGLHQLRLKHFVAGNPHMESNVTSDAAIPMIDRSSRQKRKLIYDGSVEAMLSDRVAFLAHALNPHAKIILTIREPIGRALSEYNMVIRNHNRDQRKMGYPDTNRASPEQFDYLVRQEMKKLRECGYNDKTGNLNMSTTELLDCVYPKTFSMEAMLFVTRGLYHLHIDTWRKYFPEHRMLFIPFSGVTSGKGQTMKDMSDFLCVRPYPQVLLQKYAAKASNSSYGIQAALIGSNKSGNGFDFFGGNNRYLWDIWDSTRQALEEFYGPANSRLHAMMGDRMF